MSAIEVLAAVLLNMLVGGSLGWYLFDAFFNGAAIAFTGSLVLIGVAATWTNVKRIHRS
jgi:hypothetical protein